MRSVPLLNFVPQPASTVCCHLSNISKCSKRIHCKCGPALVGSNYFNDGTSSVIFFYYKIVSHFFRKYLFAAFYCQNLSRLQSSGYNLKRLGNPSPDYITSSCSAVFDA